MASLGQAISSLFLKEFVSAFFLSMRYFWYLPYLGTTLWNVC